MSDQTTEYQLELMTPAVRADPYAFYSELRSVAPVYESPFGTYLISGHSLVLSVLQDQTMSTDLRNIDLDTSFTSQLGADEPTVLDEVSDSVMLFVDPPDHRRLRGLVSKAFTPKSIDKIKPRINEIVDGLLADCRDRGDIDFIEDFAYPLPITVICEMMGVPVADREDFARWSRMVAPSIDPAILRDPETDATIRRGNDAFGEYFENLFAQRRRQPGDDLVSGLLAAEEAGERLTENELMATCIFLLVAGHETTVNLLGNGMLSLLRFPNEADRLRRDPSLVESAVEEFLRYDSPVQLTLRITTETTEIAGIEIPPGRPLTALLGAANRDPDNFADPDTLDIARSANRHVAFGGGIHLCLGAPLARAEAQAAFGALASLEIEQTAAPKRKSTFTLRGLSQLPVRLRT